MTKSRKQLIAVATGLTVLVAALAIWRSLSDQRARARTLRTLTSVSLPASERFVAAEWFRDGIAGGPDFHDGLFDLHDTFVSRMLPASEAKVPALNIRVEELLPENTPDRDLQNLLGSGAETKLAHLYELLRRQGGGQTGPLATDNHFNVFYIRGADGTLYTHLVIYRDDGWDISAIPFGFPHSLGAGGRVFSH